MYNSTSNAFLELNRTDSRELLVLRDFTGSGNILWAFSNDNFVASLDVSGNLVLKGTLKIEGTTSGVLQADSSGNVTAGTVPILHGGTGATSASAALTALGGIGWTLPAPVSHSSPGTAGQISYDALGNLYVCVATNVWSKFTGSITF